jgi:hypothetical protein
MEKKDMLAKILSIIGTVLVWIPILAPVFFGIAALAAEGTFRFDYLMPAEFGMLVFAGGALLLWGALRAGAWLVIIAPGIVIAAGAISILNTFGDVEPGSMRWKIVMGLLITYTLATVVTGVGGILLVRDQFSK